MKKLNVFFLGLLLTITFSCSEDGGTEEVPNNDDQINQLEETVLDETVILNNLKIDGATKKTGAPSPTGGISFELENTSNSAFLKNGFSIDFTETSDEFIGAYLQIKSIDGNVADGYWDISNISSKTEPIKKKNLRSAKKYLANKSSTSGGSISVSFLDAIKPGKFCYAICVYDGAGNISQPTEVCIEVENWGGYSKLIGDWEFLSEEDIENGVSQGITKLGESYCQEDSFYCTYISPPKQIVYEWCDKITALDLTFNAEGTYIFKEDYEYNDIDYEASQNNCVAIGTYENSHYTSEGKWAYDEEEEILTLIEFYYDDDGDSETILDGEVLFQGSAFLNNEILTITDTYIDGSYTEEWILKFSKK